MVTFKSNNQKFLIFFLTQTIFTRKLQINPKQKQISNIISMKTHKQTHTQKKRKQQSYAK